MPNIKLFTVTWSTDTAGPSPDDNYRTEVFFKGCNKAITGNACLGCFNSPLWDDSADRTHDPVEMADHIAKHAPTKYITIGGGEPTDQLEGLIQLTRRLKEHGFHIMVYTWKNVRAVVNNHTNERDQFLELFTYIDMLVDGIYDPKKRLYRKDQGDGFMNSVGSGNQGIWDIRDYRKQRDYLIGYRMEDLHGLHLKDSNDLVYITNGHVMPELIKTREKRGVLVGQTNR